MRLFFLILLLSLTTLAKATNRYMSSLSGNDANVTPAIGTPWKTLGKLSTTTFAAGDTVFFKRGETFRGIFTLGQSGGSGNPIVFTYYGSGADPIISGLTTYGTWTSVGTNLYEATPDSILKSTASITVINDVPQEMGRTPNTDHYYAFNTANNTTLNSDSLTGSPNYTGAQVVVKHNSFFLGRYTVSSQAGSTLTYNKTGIALIDDNESSNFGSATEYGFFLQKFQASLDVNGEWFWNTATNKLRIFSTTNPNTLTIKSSFRDTLFNLVSRSNVTIRGLDFEGAGLYAIYNRNGANITVDSCDFNNNTRAIHFWGTLHPTLTYDTLDNSFNVGIYMNGGNGINNPRQITVQNCQVFHSGYLMGIGSYNSDANMRSMYIFSDSTSSTTSNYLNIIGNNVLGGGEMCIQWQGSNATIRRNRVDSSCTRMQDGGLIYTFVYNQDTMDGHFVNRIIDSNIVSNGIGNGWMIGNDNGVDATGIYLDDQTRNVIVKDNTIYNVSGNGIQMNTAYNVSVTGNTLYNNDYTGINAGTIGLFKKQFGKVGLVTIHKNIIYQKGTNQYMFYTVVDSLGTYTNTTWLQQMADIDSNWITNLQTNGYRALMKPWGGSYTVINANLATWQGTYGQEVHSVLPPLTVTTTNTSLVTNPSNSPLVFFFTGLRKQDPKGNVYDNSVTIPAWSSVILINNGTSPFVPGSRVLYTKNTKFF